MEKRDSIVSVENLHIWALGMIVFAVCVPLMTDYCINGVDTGFYFRRLEKVCPEDIFLFFPSLAVRAGIQTETVWKFLLAVLNILTAVIAYFCFCGIFRDRVTGLTGSMLYTWTPYRLNDLYCRADLGEAVALCFLPVVFYGLYQIYGGDVDGRKYRRAWIVPAIGYTLIARAYLLSFLVIAGFTVLFCIVMWRQTFRKPVLFLLLKTAAAFSVCNLRLFWLLFQRLRENAFSAAVFRGNTIQGGGVFPSVFLQLFYLNGSSFRTEKTGAYGLQPVGAGFAVTVGVIVYLWIAFVGRYRDKTDDGGIRMFGKGVGIAGAVMAVMATNGFPWDYLQRRNHLFFRLVESLQSPARLMQAVAVCFTILTCTALWQVRKWEKSSAGRIFAIVIAALSLLSVQYLTGDILRTGMPRNLNGAAYEEPAGEENFLPENLDISPLDYGRMESFWQMPDSV